MGGNVDHLASVWGANYADSCVKVTARDDMVHLSFFILGFRT